jgi:hypothetical protein
VLQSWKIRWTGVVAHMDAMTEAYRVVVRKPEGKRLLG